MDDHDDLHRRREAIRLWLKGTRSKEFIQRPPVLNILQTCFPQALRPELDDWGTPASKGRLTAGWVLENYDLTLAKSAALRAGLAGPRAALFVSSITTAATDR